MIFRRLRNLWRLSDIDVSIPKGEVMTKQKILAAVGIKQKKMATIIEDTNPLDVFPNENETSQ